VTVDIQDGSKNEAILPIDEGPLYIDGGQIFDCLLLGAALSFEQRVSVNGDAMSKYTIESHRQLDDVSGYIIASEDSYIAEFELRWTASDEETREFDIYTDTSSSVVKNQRHGFETALEGPQIAASDSATTTADGNVTITSETPQQGERVERGVTYTFDATLEYDTGGESPGYFGVSVRENPWGSIDEYVEISQESGSVDVTLSEEIGDDWEQAMFIVNLYPEKDGCPGDGCTNIPIADASITYDLQGGREALPDLEVLDIDWTPDEPSAGETVEFAVEVRNSGDTAAETVETRVFVDDELAHIPPLIDLDPGEQRWTVETGNQSFDAGEHTARAAIDPDDNIAEQSQSNNELERTLTVGSGEAMIDAAIGWVDVDGGTYSAGETVETTVSIENTGTTTHTFFVGYTVHGPAGSSYDNDGETGHTVTLDPGESIRADLGWAVEDDAAEGAYDVEVAVWEESDPDALSTRLDSVEESDRFSIDVTEELPDLTVSAIDWTPSTPEESEDVTFSVTVANEGQSRAEDVAIEATVGSERFRDTVSSLDAGKQQTIDLGEWTATVGSTTVQATVDPKDTIEETGRYDNTAADTITVEREEPATEINIRSVTAESARYQRGEQAIITTELANTGDATTVDIEHRLVSPKNTTQVEVVTETIKADSATSVTTTWEFTDHNLTGPYDVTISVSEQITGDVVVTRTERTIFELAADQRRTDLTIETVGASGEQLDNVIVTLDPQDGGRSLSGTSRDGSVVFEEIKSGSYSVTAASDRLYQEIEREVIIDNADNLVRQIRFKRTEPIQGIVLDADGDQVVPGVTVSIPDLTLATQTDDSGRFEFDEQLPDGSYDFEIQVGNSQLATLETTANTADELIVQTKEVGINRSITLSIPFETTPGDDDTQEMLSEADLFVSLLVRNLEKTDLALPARVSIVQQYGMVKGGVAALSSFVDTVRDLLTMDIAETVAAMQELFSMIVDDPIVIKQLAVMFLEDFREKQQDANPFSIGSVNYRAFQAGWFPAYVGIIIAVEALITRGVGRGASIASDATKLKTSIRTLNTQLRQSDRISDTAAVINKFRSESSSSDRVILEPGSVTIPATATYPEVVETATRAMYRFDQDDSQIPSLWKGEVAGNIAEMDWGLMLLERYSSSARLVTDAAGKIQRLAIGDTLIVYSAKADWRDDVEIDHVAVTRNTDGELEIDGIWEVTKSADKSSSEKREELETVRDKITDDLDSGSASPDDTVGGIPARLFRDVDDRDTSTVGPKNGDGFDERLNYDDRMYGKTAKHFERHRDFYETE